MGKLCREKPKDEKAWIAARGCRGIGASEAAAIVGVSSWKTSKELWEEKTGQRTPPDLSDNPYVEQGRRMEKSMRELYKSYHPDYKVTYHKYHLLYQSDRPWLFATLDGEITLPDGTKGALEVKTSTPKGKNGWDQWNCQIPNAYRIQVTHQLLATGWDFVDLMALLINHEGDFIVRTYRFERESLQDDLDWLLKKETEFWDSVQNRTIPPITFVF